MAAMPVLVIGLDPVWRARMQRLLATRGELDWLGAYAPAQPRRDGRSAPALLLLDGDDPLIDRERRTPAAAGAASPVLLPEPEHRGAAALHQHRGQCLPGQAVAAGHGDARASVAAESGLFVVAPSLLLEALHEGGDVPVPAPAEPPWRPRALVLAHRTPARDRALGRARHEQQADRAPTRHQPGDGQDPPAPRVRTRRRAWPHRAAGRAPASTRRSADVSATAA